MEKNSLKRVAYKPTLEGDFIFEDNYFSLLPGESKTVAYRAASDAKRRDISASGYTVKI